MFMLKLSLKALVDEVKSVQGFDCHSITNYNVTLSHLKSLNFSSLDTKITKISLTTFTFWFAMFHSRQLINYKTHKTIEVTKTKKRKKHRDKQFTKKIFTVCYDGFYCCCLFCIYHWKSQNKILLFLLREIFRALSLSLSRIQQTFMIYGKLRKYILYLWVNIEKK